MSLEKIKAGLDQLIADKNNSVLALSGKWGTGKTYLWNDVSGRSTDPAARGALYVSLFGVKDIAQLKVRLLQATLPDSQAGNVARDAGLVLLKGATKVLKAVNGGFSALDELAQFAIPQMLRGRFIVIDDIERKHSALGVDELMGFISEFSQNYNSRMLLILNTDKLSDKASWEQFRDKVIDHELTLTLAPAEAFGIAAAILSSPFANRICPAIEICGVTNIRVIVKIIRVINKLLDDRGGLPEHTLDRIVPSAVLLSALHYKGIDNAPTIEYVLGYNSLLEHVEEQMFAEAEDDKPEFADKLISRSWAAMLDKLLLSPCEDFEDVVAKYLTTGLLDSEELNKALDGYASDTESEAARERARSFFWNARWNMDMGDGDVLAEAETLLADLRLASPPMVTALHNRVMATPGGAELAERMISVWLGHFESGALEAYLADYTDKPLHPDVKNAMKRREDQLRPSITVLDACRRWVEKGVYGNAEIAAFKAATLETYVEDIRRLSGDDLEVFMDKHLELCERRSHYSGTLGQAVEHFVAACQVVRDDAPESRRARLITMLFNEANLLALL